MFLVDTDVMIDVLRNHTSAILWLQGLGREQIGLPGLVVMELLQGCQNRLEQQRIDRLLAARPLFWPTSADCQRALQDFTRYSLSHNIGMIDTLIAHTAVGAGWPLATFNQKHYRVIEQLQTIQPYQR